MQQLSDPPVSFVLTMRALSIRSEQTGRLCPVSISRGPTRRAVSGRQAIVVLDAAEDGERKEVIQRLQMTSIAAPMTALLEGHGPTPLPEDAVVVVDEEARGEILKGGVLSEEVASPDLSCVVANEGAPGPMRAATPEEPEASPMPGDHGLGPDNN